MPIELHLYKLLIYEPGGHFSRHRDTEKDDRMFATLVIQLPSVHQGGHLVVYHQGPQAEQETIHDFGGAAAHYEPHYAVHYADAEHAVTPITEGYRLALVYSICWPTNAQQISVGVDRQLAANIAKQMEFHAEKGEESAFHYFLEHEYTPKSISELGIAAFKGTDRDRANALIAANNSIVHEANRFTFYIARAERQHNFHGSGRSYRYADYHPLDDEGSITIDGWFAVDGSKVRGDPYVDYEYHLDLPNYILNPDQKKLAALWRGHRSNTYEGYLGNEGPTKDTTYFKWVLVAVPLADDDRETLTLARFASEEARLASFIASNPSSSNALIAWLQELVADRHAKWSSSSREYSTAFTSKLLELILSESFAEAVPALFKTISNILVKDIVPQLVGFLRSPFWEHACDPLLNALRDAESRFELGLYFVRWAHQNQIAPDVGAKLLPVVLSGLPATITEQQQPQITELMCAPMWGYARGPLLEALSAERNKFAVRLQLFSMAVNAQLTTDAAVSIFPIALQAIPNDLSSEKISDVILLMFAPFWEYAQGPLLAALSTTPTRFKVVFTEDDIGYVLRLMMEPLFWSSARDRVLQGIQNIPLEPPVRYGYGCRDPPGRLKFIALLVDTAIVHYVPANVLEPLLLLALSSIPQPVSHTYLRQLVMFMTPVLWPFARKHVVDALSKLPVQTREHHRYSSPTLRFEISLALVDKARDAQPSIPVETWEYLMPTVISVIAAANMETVVNSQHQPSFWRAIFATSDQSSIDLAVNTYHTYATPLQLKPVIDCILSLSENCPPHHKARLVPIFQKRMDWLRNQLNRVHQPSPSTWCMPDATFPEHPDLVGFLRGPQESMVVQGKFKSIADARNFVKKFGNRNPLIYGCSLSMTPSGVGRNATVIIRKTRAYFDALRTQAKKQAGKCAEEYRKLEGVIGTVSPSQPAPVEAGSIPVQQSGVSKSANPATTTTQHSLKRPRSPSSIESAPLPRLAPRQQAPTSGSVPPQQQKCEVIFID
ncbi:hypothetical protein HK102_008693 [Quaeritorhiza haematococci]|nr:hypothetical protein HK102_008693 [Quaeritorhiza haematococci]